MVGNEKRRRRIWRREICVMIDSDIGYLSFEVQFCVEKFCPI